MTKDEIFDAIEKRIMDGKPTKDLEDKLLELELSEASDIIQKTQEMNDEKNS